MAATHPFYSTADMATKLLPALCAMTLDKEKEVRDHVFKTLHLFLDKLERISDDPEAAEEQEKTEGTLGLGVPQILIAYALDNCATSLRM